MGHKLLLTGGTGSFGEKFVEVALKGHDYDVIRVYSRSEFLQYEMARKYDDGRLRFLIGDVRDKVRLFRAAEDVDIIVHAAALKQIPTVEYNPIEAVRTNIEGTINVIDVAVDTDVERVIGISSDKSCQPANLYGATKMVAEKLFIQANVYTGKKKTKFACVRYGNVVGSRGSLMPLLQEQRKSGVVTITDEHMTRFWLTLEQGVEFVMQCLERMKGGEIFIPKISSMKVLDVLDVIAPEAEKKIIGIRPGEKMHEVLFTEEESRHTLEFDDCYVVVPEFAFWGSSELKVGGTPAQIQKYSSDTNTKWLTKDELREMIDGIDS